MASFAAAGDPASLGQMVVTTTKSETELKSIASFDESDSGTKALATAVMRVTLEPRTWPQQGSRVVVCDHRLNC